MRWLGRLLTMVVVLGVAWWGSGHPWLAQGRLGDGPSELAQWMRTAKSAIVYRLDRETWTVFPVGPAARQVKISTNGEVAGPRVDGDEQLEYAVEYQLVDSAGSVLAEGAHHLRSGLRLFRDPVSGQALPSAAYPSGPLQPLDTRVMLLSLGAERGAGALRLRAAHTRAPLQGVVARVYALEPVAEHKLRYLWQRLSPERQAQLAKASVYPPELLQEREKRNLLREQWTRLAPSGIAGEDYRSVVLYAQEAMEGQPVEEPIPPPGLPLGPGLRAVIPLPKVSGTLELQVEPLVESVVAGDASGTVHWYGQPANRYRRTTFPWSGRPVGVELPVDGGVVEVELAHQAAVRAWLRREGDRVEVTPDTRYLRVYLATEKEPVSYRVAHSAGRATPVRVDLRAVAPAMEGAEVAYELLDAEGTPVQEGTLPLVWETSLYDSLAAQTDLRVSEPARYFFNLPSHVSGIRFSSSSVVMVALLSRPPARPIRQVVPQSLAEDDASWQTWFPLRPADYEELRRQDRSLLLNVQRRPPEVEPDLLAGRYAWQSYLPQGDWAGHYLLTPMEPGAPLRDEALANRYGELSGERAWVLRDPYGRPIRASLLYLRERRGPMSVRVWLDGVLHHEQAIFASVGEIELPPFAPGPRRIRVEGQGRFFINHVADEEEARFLKQLAKSVSAAGVDFLYDKESPEAEVLSARFYGPLGYPMDQHLVVCIEGVPPRGTGPHREWTVLERRITLAPVSGEPVPVLSAGAEAIDSGRNLFIQLGSDIPAGRYRIGFHMERGPGGLLALSRVTPGLYDRVELRFEP